MLHHVEINVTDLNKASEFWGWFLSELKYEVYQEWDRGISWKFNTTYIVFVQAEEKFIKSGYHRSRVGLNHLAFYAESREQVDQMTAKLKERDLTILYQDRHPFAGGTDHYAVFFEGPDRMKVELVAP
ncbi:MULTISPECIES: VOC family protein [unclassified Bacillus (in: firmicutes)]|uniref:VOC family protein n=1 Tax=unclassified Bacillus (in: firmicutes) TaxID=185979 RepID=UPI001BE8D3DE|nr:MULTISPECIES: VOC family protein [unclassified Bacillus (in: firmicutes)]MBT2638248.1 VOC family protein [Bacillus sp. ISL-39]MBT2662656.1 VOC family protein [Bacillus sp. ISL-45]